MTRSARCLVFSAALLCIPAAAKAHSPIQGAGDFVNGLLHPLLTPHHILLIVGLGLMAGRQSIPDLNVPAWSFGPLSALALILTFGGWIREIYPPFLIGLALCSGVLLALEKIPPRPVTCALFATAALGLGFDSAVDGASPGQKFKILLGNWIGLNLLMFDIAIYVTLGGQAKWLKIALRIAGSWLIAISLMTLAFVMRK